MFRLARWRGWALGLAVSAISCVGVAWWAAHQSPPTFPSSLRSVLEVLAALAVYAVVTTLRGARWSAILRRAGIACSPIEPYALTVVGYMGNTVLPLRGGEILRVALLTDRSNAGWREALGSIVPDRVLDFAALVILLLAITFASVGGAPAGETPALLAAALLVFAVALGFVYLSLRSRGHLERFADRVRPYARASRILFTPIGAVLLLVTVGIWLLEALVLWLVAESLSLHITVLEALMVDVVATFSGLIPAGPAYIGTYDAGMLFVLRALGIPSSAALTFTLMVRFVLFVPITILGLFLVVFRYGGLSQLVQKPAVESAESR
jgi:uncharacterized membrane protein YbhN (UPF0104 family)